MIESSPFRFEGIRQALTAAGLQAVVQAGSGNEAVTRVAEELVDVVFTPWEAGDLSGTQLFDALRERSAEPRVALVLLDDDLPQATVVRAVKAGVLGRTSVPPEPTHLRALLATIAEES